MARRKLVGRAGEVTKAKSATVKKAVPSAEKLDAELAARAIEKQFRHEKPTREESAALKRAHRVKEEERRLDYYRTVSQKHYRQLAGGRQTKQLQDMARLYGIPCDGTNVDLFVVIDKFHDLIAANGPRLRRPGDVEEPTEDTLEFWKKENEKAKARRNQRMDDMEAGRVIATDEHERVVDQLCAAFRSSLMQAAGAISVKVAGRSVQEVKRAIDTWAEGVVDRFFGTPE